MAPWSRNIQKSSAQRPLDETRGVSQKQNPGHGAILQQPDVVAHVVLVPTIGHRAFFNGLDEITAAFGAWTGFDEVSHCMRDTNAV